MTVYTILGLQPKVYVCWYVVIKQNAIVLFEKKAPQLASMEPCILCNCANRTIAIMTSRLHENKRSFRSPSTH